jgi:predicted AAA+ superfamily ATPase
MHFMERKIANELLIWKNKLGRAPLLLRGARQVGKTYALLSFGKQYYKNVAYFSMEGTKEILAIFGRDLNPNRIVRELAAYSGQSILPGNTLIIFDEIQGCEQALASLRYFAERAPQYHIIAAGSLPDSIIKREKYIFPAGKVDMLNLYPMDFEEFLWAISQIKLCVLIREAFKNFMPLLLHDKAMDLYKTYLVVGGMPRVVQEYAFKRDFDFVRALQGTLNDSFIADMAKYATPQETARIMAAWESVPAQLTKDNRKFQYSVIKSGARAKDYEAALNWLNEIGMINKCIHVTEGKAPLAAYAQKEVFKAYMVDTGMLCSKLGITASMLLHTPYSTDGLKGVLAENYIMQALAANGITPNYWSSQGKAGVEFIFQDRRGNVIPLETKPNGNSRSKSLRTYNEIYKPAYSVRVSAKNFGFENGIMNIPLYAMFCLKG